MDTAAIVDRIVARRGQTANAAAEETYILDAVNEAYRDVLAYHDWPWLRDQVLIRTYPLMDFTGTVTQGSAVVTALAPALAAAQAVYEGGWLADENGEIHEVLDINWATNQITLREPWVGATTAVAALDLWYDRYSIGAPSTVTWTGVGTVALGSPIITAIAPAHTAANAATYEGGWCIGINGEAHRILDINPGVNMTLVEPWVGPNTVGLGIELIGATPEVEYILSIGCTSDVKGGYQVTELTETEIDTYVADRRYPSATNLLYWSRGGIDIMGRPTIRLWPIPRENLYVQVHIKKRPPALTNTTTSIPQLPNRWHDVLVAGALAFMSCDDGLSDPAANRYLILYTSKKDEMVSMLAKTETAVPRQFRRWDQSKQAGVDPREWWRYLEQ